MRLVDRHRRTRTHRALPPVAPPPRALRAAQALRRGVARVHRGTTLPLLTVLEQVVGMVEVRATAAFVELGLADALGDHHVSTEALADAVDADPDAVERLLAFLATRGLVRRRAGGWRLTAAGALLRSDHPDSVAAWVRFVGSAWQWRAWEGLEDGVRDPSTTPFARVHGEPYFDHLAARPARAEVFDAAMRSTSRLQGELLARALDLAGVDEVCDVGGGTGSVLAALLRRHGHLRGSLLELPGVVERARAELADSGMADRVALVAGDMFAAVPAGADRYLLSAVLHDWPDDDAVRILAAVRDAMTRSSARAVVVELELPPHDGASLERAYDLLMLVLGGGRERTHAELVDLYTRAGLRLDTDVVLANGWHAHHLAVAPGRGGDG